MYYFVVTVHYTDHIGPMKRAYFLEGPDSETVLATARRIFLADAEIAYANGYGTRLITRLEYDRKGIILHA